MPSLKDGVTTNADQGPKFLAGGKIKLRSTIDGHDSGSFHGTDRSIEVPSDDGQDQGLRRQPTSTFSKVGAWSGSTARNWMPCRLMVGATP
jgi:hypothetical protein